MVVGAFILLLKRLLNVNMYLYRVYKNNAILNIHEYPLFYNTKDVRSMDAWNLRRLVILF